MVRVLLCDDDADDLKRMETMTRAFYGDAAEVLTFSRAEGALEYVERGGRVDVALLDILMPGMNGTALAQRLRKLGYRGHIGFLTASNDYAAESYRVDAIGYLLKPVERSALCALLGKARPKPEEDGPCFLIKQNRRVQRVRFGQFMYLEVLDHKLYFHLADGAVIQAYATLAAYAPVLLGDPRCGRCHKSFIVNMDYVDLMDGKLLRMRDGRQLTVSRNFADFSARYLRWVFNQGDAP